MSTPGAVTVVENTNYPNTGDANSDGAVVLGWSLLLGLIVVYRKKLMSLFKFNR